VRISCEYDGDVVLREKTEESLDEESLDIDNFI